MSKTGGFNRTLKITIGVMDILIYHLSFVVSFLIRYRGTIPTFNYSAYQSVLPYIAIAFIIINIFSGIYILYNKNFIDMFSITLISQIIMYFFFGLWVAFPITIVFINLIISTLLLTILRFMILEFYLKKSGTSRVMIVGSMDSCMEAVQNFKSSKTRQYKGVAVVTDNYYENVKNNIDNIDVFYLLDFHTIEEENKILSYLTFNNKRVFLGTDFGNILRINNRIMNIDDESLIAISKFEIAPENDAIKRMID